MEFILTQKSIIIPALVGQITEKKKNILGDILSNEKDFQFIIQQQQNILVFASALESENFVIYPDRITYNKLGEGELDINRVKELLSEIFDGLLLDDNVKANAVFDIQAVSTTTNSHSETVNVFNEKFDGILSHDNISGVGYRFLINNKEEQYSGEFKIEPYIMDQSKYFYQYIINLNIMTYSIDEIVNLFVRFNREMVLTYNDLTDGLSIK